MAKKQKIESQNKKRLEVSQIIALFSGCCFAAVLLYSMFILTYNNIKGTECNATLLTILISTTSTVFGLTATTYYNKARHENAHKIAKSFLKTKYLILKDINMLDEQQIQEELSVELNDIDVSFRKEKEQTNQEITYKE